MSDAHREMGELLASQSLGDETPSEAEVARDQARGMVIELEGENAKLLAELSKVQDEYDSFRDNSEYSPMIQSTCEAWDRTAAAERELEAVTAERDAALLAAEVATGTPCWRCGGAA